MKSGSQLAVIDLFAVFIFAAAQFLHSLVYYPHVIADANDNLKLEFLQQSRPTGQDCQNAAATNKPMECEAEIGQFKPARWNLFWT